MRDGDLYVMGAGGGDQPQLTDNLPYVGAPRWSPDSQQIVFMAYPRRGNGDVYLIKADGSGLTNLTNSEDDNDSDPVWSPSGQQIAFVSNRHQGAQVEIYVMWSDGSQPTRLTVNDAIDSNPTWSPDGQRIAFASNRSGSFAIYSMRFDGIDQIFLTNGEAPAWSPTNGQARARHSRTVAAARHCVASSIASPG